MKFCTVTPFAPQLTPQTVTAALRTLRANNNPDAEAWR
jgi:hypothetical protein